MNWAPKRSGSAPTGPLTRSVVVVSLLGPQDFHWRCCEGEGQSWLLWSLPILLAALQTKYVGASEALGGAPVHATAAQPAFLLDVLVPAAVPLLLLLMITVARWLAV
jgi:hypothetical protein